LDPNPDRYSSDQTRQKKRASYVDLTPVECSDALARNRHQLAVKAISVSRRPRNVGHADRNGRIID
jgi:hypothetical protein